MFYLQIYVYLHIYISLYVYIYIYICVCVCLTVSMIIHMQNVRKGCIICICKYTCSYTCICACVVTCKHIQIYTSQCTYTQLCVYITFENQGPQRDVRCAMHFWIYHGDLINPPILLIFYLHILAPFYTQIDVSTIYLYICIYVHICPIIMFHCWS